jgi:hypothetical protein
MWSGYITGNAMQFSWVLIPEMKGGNLSKKDVRHSCFVGK